MGKREEGELPEGWMVITIGEAGTVQLGRQRAPQFHSGSSMRPYLRVQNVFDDRIDLDDVMEMDFPGDDAEKYELKPDDILLNEGQSPELLGRPAMYRGELPGACFTNTLIRFQVGPNADPRYCLQLFRYYMKSGVFRGKGTITTNIAHLGAGRFASLSMPFPPLPEQQRIAVRLDLLLGKLKTARTRLDAMGDIIARFRKSVLAEAVSGRLTQEWREEYSPDDWQIKTISDIGTVQLGRQRAPKFHAGQNLHPYLRVQNVFENRIDLDDVMEMDFPSDDFERYELKSGDILLNEGQSPELLGRPAMYRGELPGACFTNTLIRFQTGPLVDPSYCLYVFRWYMRSGRFRAEGTITTNIAHLGAGRFANIEFPLPSLPEQYEIVRRVDELFAYADALEKRVAEARALADRLEPSILAKAFRGELSEQVPEEAAEWEKTLAELEAVSAGLAANGKTKRSKKVLDQAAEPKAGYAAAPKKRGRPRKTPN